ncbi:glutamate mutase L [Bacteriovoracaceae bacterium]|nr:glutamate mutase L [Bacteriovoracaceae bacterium]
MGRPIYLLTDSGFSYLQCALVKDFNGIYRVADEVRLPTFGDTHTTPEHDTLIKAIYQLQSNLNYPLVNSKGSLLKKSPFKKGGVDGHLYTSSSAGTLQCMIVGTPKMDLYDKQLTFLQGAGILILNKNQKQDPHYLLSLVSDFLPQTIVLFNGHNKSTTAHITKFANLLSYCISARHHYFPTVIFAGGFSPLKEVKDALSGICQLVITDTALPTASEKNLLPLQLELQNIYLEFLSSNIQNKNLINRWITESPGASPGDLGLSIKLYQKLHQPDKNIMATDFGRSQVSIYSIYNNIYHRSIFAQEGVSNEMPFYFEKENMKKMKSWLPSHFTVEDIQNGLITKALNNTSIPATVDELALDHAYGRLLTQKALSNHDEILMQSICGKKSSEDARFIDYSQIEIIVATGGIYANCPRLGQAMQMLLDGFSIPGWTTYYLDKDQLLSRVGALYRQNETLAKELLQNNLPIELGTSYKPLMTDSSRQTLFEFKIKLRTKVYHEELKRGQLKNYQFPKDERAIIEIIPAKDTDIGLGKGIKLEKSLISGACGFYLDARHLSEKGINKNQFTSTLYPDPSPLN